MEQESKTETTFIPRVRVEAGTAMYFDPETLKVYDSLTGQYIGDMVVKAIATQPKPKLPPATNP